jgi:hypothetical protein
MNSQEIKEIEREMVQDNPMSNLVALVQLFGANPEWGVGSKPKFMRQGLECLIDSLLLLSSRKVQKAERLNSEPIFTNERDSLSNNKTIKFSPKMEEISEQFSIKLTFLYEQMLEILVSVHLDLIHTQGQEFSEATEAMAAKFLKENPPNRGTLDPQSKDLKIGSQRDIKSQYRQNQKVWKGYYARFDPPSKVISKLIEERKIRGDQDLVFESETDMDICNENWPSWPVSGQPPKKE